MTRTRTTGTHPLDHLVLPTQNLDTARARLAALGFIVAPTGVHPFGTENCCVFLSDGTYLEPLAVGDEHAAMAAIANGNVFVARDRTYRDSRGDEGFSALVLGTDSADSDHARYAEAGISAGEILSFSRAFADPSGKSDIASFKLAFAANDTQADAFLFACERVNAPKVDRTALQAHANGAEGMVEIIAVSDAPATQSRLVSIATGAVEQSGTIFHLPNATLTLLDPEAFEARFGLATGMPSKFRFAAIVFSVRSIDALSRLLAANAINHDIRGNGIIVRPAPGQGAAFVFQETR
ncbi:VOC family protein [Mesorhizobium sp. INR15]|uniref:VOC family protein n=1 Tax=Mesorhizobium sp. INR15 TaxID=2654248 RepID=UPI0018963F1A|nr:VOC family protein [Mesorhizobium sp. INR15]QPC93169.1 VOC family protein [Mesorhizobium sp. INR15]